MFWLIGLIFSIGGSLINLLLLVAALIFVVDALFGRRKTMWYLDINNTDRKKKMNAEFAEYTRRTRKDFYISPSVSSASSALSALNLFVLSLIENLIVFLLDAHISAPFVIGNNLLHYNSPFYVLIINLYVIISFVKRHEDFFFYIKLLLLGGKNFICLMLD